MSIRLRVIASNGCGHSVEVREQSTLVDPDEIELVAHASDLGGR